MSFARHPKWFITRSTSIFSTMARRPISQFPSPLRRYFAEHPSEKRRVIATIGRFTGYGIHFHVILREEDEAVYAADSGTWEVPSQDPAGEGRERMMKFRTRRAAERWIHRTFRSEFSPKTHELIIRPPNAGIQSPAT